MDTNNFRLNPFARWLMTLGRNKVTVLLDLQGSLTFQGEAKEPYKSFRSNGYANWLIRDKVVEWLKERREDPQVELYWSSTWQEFANSIFVELGLPSIEAIDFDDTYPREGSWLKEDGITLFLQDCKNPVVIIDNELPESFLEIDNSRLLFIKPNSATGITDEELERIDQFVEDYRERKLL